MTRPQHYARHVDAAADAEPLAARRWTSGACEHAHVTLATSLSAPAQARAWAAAESAAAGIAAAQRDKLMLALSELVTNAVRHAPGRPGSTMDVHLGMAEGSLRLEVHDGGSGFAAAAVPPATDDRAGLRGLMIIDALVSRWGTHRDGHGHCVWVEVD